MSIYKSCDVRGVVGQDWDVDEALHIGCAIGRMLCVRRQRSIYVGGDFRRSTAALQAALMDGLRCAGIDVVDVGHVPTPVVYYAARHAGCANAAIITASHNPGKYNGIKFLIDGRPPTAELMSELQANIPPQDEARLASPPPASEPSCGKYVERHVVADYEAWVVAHAGELVITSPGAAGREREPDAPPGPRRVAVDAMGGAFTSIAPRVLAAAGYEVLTVDPQFDPDFVRREPDPAQDRNLQPLIDLVQADHADLGIALDGDGDRVIFVDERGAVARPEQIAGLLIEHLFPGGALVYDLKCASLVPHTVLAHRGQPIMQPSGHGYIKTMMLDARADLGVEVSGHHFFGALKGGDDGLFTALVVLELLNRLRTTLGAHLQRIGWPSITPDLRVPVCGDVQAILEAIAAHCGGDVRRMDGVRVQYADGWGLARASITEPAMTFRFEGDSPARLRQVVARFLAGVPELRQQLLEMIP